MYDFGLCIILTGTVAVELNIAAMAISRPIIRLRIQLQKKSHYKKQKEQ
jgi:hypothetical protein